MMKYKLRWLVQRMYEFEWIDGGGDERDFIVFVPAEHEVIIYNVDWILKDFG